METGEQPQNYGGVEVGSGAHKTCNISETVQGVVSLVCMPMSSKFRTESTAEKIVKIGQYLAKVWTKYAILFWASL